MYGFQFHVVSNFVSFLFRNQVDFSVEDVQRSPNYPKNNGSDVLIKIYVNYPNETVTLSNATVIDKKVLASLIFEQLAFLEKETKLDLVVETSFAPDAPRTPTSEEADNAVLMDINNFDTQLVSF